MTTITIKAPMNEWHAFLTKQGAIWQGERLEAFANPTQSKSRLLIPMVEHQLLQIKGADAAKFLQGQCTCDVRDLEQDKVLIGAHCNRQGRMLSSFTVTGLADQSIGLRLRRSIAQSTLTALARYIVFSKASIEVSRWVGLAIVNAQAEAFPLSIPPMGHFAMIDEMAVLHHRSGLIEIWTDMDRAQRLWQSLASSHSPAPPSALDEHFIENGLVEVQAQTQEQYIPQHFNYQAIGAISFKKGCYTGQEIVARMQYRSQLKKHCYRLTSSDPEKSVELGTALCLPNDIDKKVAEVVASAAGQILAVTTEDIQATQGMLVEPSSQTNFSWSELPYAIP